MKITMIALFFSISAFAQMPKMPTAAAVKDLSKQVFDACKDDKSKVKGCEAYTEVAKLKTCLMANEAVLSAKCKNTLKLVK